MELKDAIMRRRSLRDFSAQPVPRELVEEALAAGLKAPSYNHLKEWDFVLVNDPGVRLALTQTEPMTEQLSEELRQQFAGYDETARAMYFDAIPKQKRMLLRAPELLVVVYKPKTQVAASQTVYDLNCLASVWCCIENILLSLAAHDVFGVTFIPQNSSAVKQALNIPHALEVAALIPFGYKAATAKQFSQTEVRLSERLHTDGW